MCAGNPIANLPHPLPLVLKKFTFATRRRMLTMQPTYETNSCSYVIVFFLFPVAGDRGNMNQAGLTDRKESVASHPGRKPSGKTDRNRTDVANLKYKFSPGQPAQYLRREELTERLGSRADLSSSMVCGRSSRVPKPRRRATFGPKEE